MFPLSPCTFSSRQRQREKGFSVRPNYHVGWRFLWILMRPRHESGSAIRGNLNLNDSPSRDSSRLHANMHKQIHNWRREGLSHRSTLDSEPFARFSLNSICWKIQLFRDLFTKAWISLLFIWRCAKWAIRALKFALWWWKQKFPANMISDAHKEHCWALNRIKFPRISSGDAHCRKNWKSRTKHSTFQLSSFAFQAPQFSKKKTQMKSWKFQRKLKSQSACLW